MLCGMGERASIPLTINRTRVRFPPCHPNVAMSSHTHYALRKYPYYPFPKHSPQSEGLHPSRGKTEQGNGSDCPSSTTLGQQSSLGQQEGKEYFLLHHVDNITPLTTRQRKEIFPPHVPPFSQRKPRSKNPPTRISPHPTDAETPATTLAICDWRV